MPESTEQRADFTAGLRQLADILDAHPELPLPYQGSDPRYGRMSFHFLSAADPRAEMADARRALGVPMDKDSDRGEYFDLNGSLHGLYFTLTAFRKDVCKRVVVATREETVTEPDPAAVAALPKVTRTVTVEDVRWECTPLLAPAGDTEVSA